MVAARFALASARPALRRAALPLPRLASGPVLARANSSSSTSSHAAHASSDTPWALTSAVVFGSLFFYLTSPASKTHNEHGHITGGHSPTTHGAGASVTDDKTGDDAVWKQDDEESARAHAEHVENEGKLTHAEDAPAGDKHIAQNSRTAPADQQKSPTNRDPSNSTVGIENSNFQVSTSTTPPACAYCASHAMNSYNVLHD